MSRKFILAFNGDDTNLMQGRGDFKGEGRKKEKEENQQVKTTRQTRKREYADARIVEFFLSLFPLSRRSQDLRKV